MNTNIPEDKFNEIYKKYFEKIRCYINAFIYDVGVSEDLAQQTFLKFLKSDFAGFEDEQYVVAFLKAIAKNCFKNHLRHRHVAGRNFLLVDDYNVKIIFKAKKGKVVNSEDAETTMERYNYIGLANKLDTFSAEDEYERIRKEVAFEELVSKIRQLVEAMPPKQKEAMLEVYFNGLKPREAAKKLKSTANRISFLTYKGREQLINKVKYVQNLF
jgi:RNA polymerase sigma factor (sigma-70 family)